MGQASESMLTGRCSDVHLSRYVIGRDNKQGIIWQRYDVASTSFIRHKRAAVHLSSLGGQGKYQVPARDGVCPRQI
jgi:hypothetical protein